MVQHEYGIYGGPDGCDVIDIVAGLTVPTIIVLHTVLQEPTPRQRRILRWLVESADVVVTMTETARQRLVASYGADPDAVVVIPHGAIDHGPVDSGAARAERLSTGRPLVLTWGLLGPGKGIEWAIDAMPGLRDLRPALPGHRQDASQGAPARRRGVPRRAWRGGRDSRGVADIVELDDRYLEVGELADLVQRADVVLLPYDSREQVTSGVLIEAVAAGRPVVSTAFPHAVELLGDGTGLVVPQRDPAALRGGAAPGARRARTRRRAGGARPRGRPRTCCGALSPPATSRSRSRWSPHRCRPPRERAAGAPPGTPHPVPALHPPAAAHRRRWSVRARPRHHPASRARLLRRRRRAGAGGRLPRGRARAGRPARALPVVRAGRAGRRRPVPQPSGTDLRWRGAPSVEDCWGRALWGLGAAAGDPRALAAFDREARGGVRLRRAPWPSPRSAPRRCSPCTRGTAARWLCSAPPPR